MEQMTGETIDGFVFNSSFTDQITLEKCRIRNCLIGTKPSSVRYRIGNATLEGCKISNAIIGPVILENICLENTQATDPVWFRGTAFINCVFKGAVSGMISFGLADPLLAPNHKENAAIVSDNKAIYENVKCAIDLTMADCHDVDFRGIPAEKILVNGQN